MKAVFKPSWGEEPRLVDIPVPVPKAGEVLVKVKYAGICKTDLRVASGELACRKNGVILGHEFSGTVVACRARGVNIKTGDEVVVNPMLDDISDAMLGKDEDGCFAEYAVAPASHVQVVPEFMRSEMKLAAYCEPVAAASGAASKIPAHVDEVIIAGNPEDRITRLLALCIESCAEDEGRARPRRVRIVRPEKLLLSVARGQRRKPLHECVVECCAPFAGKLLGCLAPNGTLVLKSRGYVELSGAMVNDIALRELRIVGARYSSFQDALDDMASRKDVFKKLISRKDFALEEFNRAFETASRPGAKKVMFRCAQ